MPREGIFVEVLQGGMVKAGDEVQVLSQEDAGAATHREGA
jgi:MOSC domain-containing protein YiiM